MTWRDLKAAIDRQLGERFEFMSPAERDSVHVPIEDFAGVLAPRAALLDPKDCAHEVFAGLIKTARLLDTGRFVAEISIQCSQCGEPFRFLGATAGLDFDRPTCSIDELVLHAPIEPQGTPRLQTSARYVVPQIPTRQ